MIDPGALTLRGAGDLLADRSISAVELAEATLRRIAETEPHVHAYAYVNAESALEAARRADGAAHCTASRSASRTCSTRRTARGSL